MPLACRHHHQRGAGLLLLLPLLSLLASLALISWPDPVALSAARARHSALVLKRARDALTAWAMLYPEQHNDMPPGYLPCPDMDGDGNAEPVCRQQGVNVIGLLPWRTLGLPPLRDGAGECLWYALSGNYKNSPKQPLSSDSDGMLHLHDESGGTVLGANARQRALALVIAPGPPLPAQRRPRRRGACRGNGAVDVLQLLQHYLESSARFASTASLLQQVPPRRSGDRYNDTLLALTPADFMPVYRRMNYWVASRVGFCLQRYAMANGGRLPWMVPMASPGHYYDRDGTNAGRIANATENGGPQSLPGLAATLASNAQMTDAWEPWPGAAHCFYESGQRAEQWWWWRAWKDMVFVVSDDSRTPSAETATESSLQLDGQAQDAVVLVAGRRLSGQRRPAVTAAHYLEGTNIRLQGREFVSSQPGSNDIVIGIRIGAADGS